MLASSHSAPTLAAAPASHDAGIGTAHTFSPGKRVAVQRPTGSLEQGFAAFAQGSDPHGHLGRRHLEPRPARCHNEPAFAAKRHVPCTVTPFSAGRDWDSTRRHIEPARPRSTEWRGIRILACADRPDPDPEQDGRGRTREWFHRERRHIDTSAYKSQGRTESSLDLLMGSKKKDIDARNGYGVGVPGDKPYVTPDDSQFFFRSSHVPSTVWRPPKLKPSSADLIRPSRFLEGRWTAYGQSQQSLDRRKDEEVMEVRNLDEWKPAVVQLPKPLKTEVEPPAASPDFLADPAKSATPSPPPIPSQQPRKKGNPQPAAKKGK